MDNTQKNKVLFVATVVKTHIMEFHIPYLKMFKDYGWETYVAAKNDYDNPEDCNIPYCDYYYDTPFERCPLKAANIRAYKTLKKVIDDNNFNIIHCHTPVGAMISRFAAISARKRGTKVIYTAHGFHFFKGAPLLNWIIYFPVEWLCAFMTDTLITINQEDYQFAAKYIPARSVKYIPGVGIDLSKFALQAIDIVAKRKSLCIPNDKIWVISVGELIPRKNHVRLIKAISEIPEIYLTIAGRGVLKGELDTLINQLGLSHRVKLLGYRSDIPELCTAADIFAFPSMQEGLPVALMEAMACSKAVVCSRIRGCTDLIDTQGGILFNPHRIIDIKEAILTLLESDRTEMGTYNHAAIQQYDIACIINQMQDIYKLQ
ncbi:glycosyltransferase family 4 protein [Bacteroides sp. AN502(2024)]|uniref:glycosyltransferase family 4 protein n=1 Tax=Bacteroides sp. AN502(2024) TaxID=3160599 RepID=UPI0035142978